MVLDMKTAIVIPIFNRSEYVKQCFDSLLKLTTKPDLIVLVDDASTDISVRTEIGVFITLSALHKIECKIFTNEKNLGVRGSLKKGIEYLIEQKDIHYFINLDSDSVVKPDFVKNLTILHKGFEDHIISGFNCITKENPALPNAYDYFAYKVFCNGINMCFNRTQYEKYIKPSLAKDGNWDYNTSLACQADNLPFIITTPSVVQHIGMVSSMGHHHSSGADRASDFKMIRLPDVTLFGIDSHDAKGIQRAATISQYDIQFAECNIITDDLFTKNGTNEQRRNDYSRFMLKELANQFSTSHVLTIHADGYVLNWKAWDDEFLEYDYIGATWTYKDNMNVGNGGFSLRSKKLCDILATNFIEPDLMHPEDHCICRTYRKSLENNFGIKFAPEEVANRFAIEAYGASAIKGANKYSGQFGFHSQHIDFSDSGLPKDILYPAHSVQPEVITRRTNNTQPLTRVDRVRAFQQQNK